MAINQLNSLFKGYDEIDESGVLTLLLKSYAVVNYSNQKKRIKYSDGFRDLISLGYQIIRSFFRSMKSLNVKEGLPILTHMSKRPHLFKMNDILASSLNEECTRAYFYSVNSIKGKYTLELSGFPHKVFRALTWTNASTFFYATKLFYKFIRANSLGRSHLLPFTIHLLRQYASLGTFQVLFRKTKVPFIVCEYDQYNEIASFVLAARQAGIPTYTQTHGLLNSKFAYYPLIADKIFAWGNYHRELLLSWGVSPERILVTGATQYESIEGDLVKNPKTMSRFNLQERVLSVGTNPMKDHIKVALIKVVKSLALDIPSNWSIVLRPHPSEGTEDYKATFKESTNIKVLNNSDIGISELLMLSDIVMVWNSAFAIDALIKRINTFHFKLEKTPSEGEVQKLVQKGLIPSFSSSLQVLAYINTLSYSIGKRSELADDRYKIFKEEYCTEFGERAAAKMLSAIG
jgi:hypothetical protein